MPQAPTKALCENFIQIAGRRRTEEYAKTPLQRLKEAGVPTQFAKEMRAPQVATYIKAMQGHSRTAAIKAKCLDCCGWSRSEASKCDLEACSLWPYNPYRRSRLRSRQNRQVCPGQEAMVRLDEQVVV